MLEQYFPILLFILFGVIVGGVLLAVGSLLLAVMGGLCVIWGALFPGRD